MLRCAASFVIAAYDQVRLIPHDFRASPTDFLDRRPEFKTFAGFFMSLQSGDDLAQPFG